MQVMMIKSNIEEHAHPRLLYLFLVLFVFSCVVFLSRIHPTWDRKAINTSLYPLLLFSHRHYFVVANTHLIHVFSTNT